MHVSENITYMVCTPDESRVKKHSAGCHRQEKTGLYKSRQYERLHLFKSLFWAQTSGFFQLGGSASISAEYWGLVSPAQLPQEY